MYVDVCVRERAGFSILTTVTVMVEASELFAYWCVSIVDVCAR